MINMIGTNAGLVWRALHRGGKLSIKDLKKETRLRTEKEVYAAVGWLAKEGKISLAEERGDMYVWLI
jgi:hypothetical protein